MDSAVFGVQAESATTVLAKARMVLMEGWLTQQTWTDPKRHPFPKQIVMVERVKFVDALAAKTA